MKEVVAATLTKALVELLDVVTRTGAMRSAVLKAAEKKLYQLIVEVNPTGRPRRIQEDKYFVARNMLRSVNRALSTGTISSPVRHALLNILVGEILVAVLRRGLEPEVLTDRPPGFITISPTQRCNLKCRGCYAASESGRQASLEFSLVDRIVKEKTASWESHFTVISGGEPFLWRSEDKDLLDLARANQDNFFLVYTNGTLIDRGTAQRLAEVGNISPAVSVEGFREQTDERRGQGAHARILEGFANLREAGVPFGISLTVTRGNVEVVMSKELMDFYFLEQGAIYGWLFQYMPIGRGSDLQMMVTPSQRRWMFEREQNLIRDHEFFLADFWNSGAVSNGCISAGRSGGYFYIDWNGNATPCVFYPYTTHNIRDVYASGGNLGTIIDSPFFHAIREWQRSYGYMAPPHEIGNQIVPCAIRDHYDTCRSVIERFGAKPIDEAAQHALADMCYAGGMETYGRKAHEATRDIWEQQYVPQAG
jgi:MoaA/NifB/PqqE/SkfB family radical SAM enzyme